MGAFLVTFSLLGLLIGTLGGLVSRLIHWHPAKTFLASLALFMAALAVPETSNLLGFGDSLAAIVLAPLLVFLPTAAGFVAGRRLATLFFRSEDKPGD